MMSRSVRVRRHLRSARVSALTEEERRAELREAEQRAARHEQTEPVEKPGDDAEAAVPPSVTVS
jgi:hypothetical protein